MAACAAPGRVFSTVKLSVQPLEVCLLIAACVLYLDVSDLHQPCPLDVSGLQQPVLPLNLSLVQQSVLPLLDVSVLQQPLLPPGRVCSTAACAAPWTCLFYSCLCCPLDVSALIAACSATVYCLFTRGACAAPESGCLQELLCCIWYVCLQELCAAPGFVCLNATA
jgi:hypothetical protein